MPNLLWPHVKKGSHVVAQVNHAYLYGTVKARHANGTLDVRAHQPHGSPHDATVETRFLLFELSEAQFKAAREAGWPQTSEGLMQLVNWSKGGST